ncbi:MAG: BlaI/MecI/CopY family transcriptional regulator [Saprospiraceae bacterium]|nr:BlaI/MecI/CopY family transcriptional regulator [Bacteroidia bacterium]NNE16589.1 BlaI/MecI/CopY family transcriptional regulator [Saprospiraceae bacterium]NNL91517.1 BlaI/MecI/CopY family transcriptional regulator [Saprospiraceae bacterium]
MKRLTKAEEEIMHMVWETGPCTVSQIIKKMEEPHPPHSTISSIFRILEKKGFLDHKSYGRTYEYFPIIEKKAYTRFSLKDLVSNYFEGSLNNMVSFLVEENDLNLKELSKVIESLDTAKKESNQKQNH